MQLGEVTQTVEIQGSVVQVDSQTANREVTLDECLRATSEPNEFLRMVGEPVPEEEGKTAGQVAGNKAQAAAMRR